jgi:hypothetical protein
MTRLLIAITALLCATAHADVTPLFESTNPSQLTAEGCVMASDMLLTARALAAESVDRKTADAVMATIFAPWADGGLNNALRSQLTDIAYRSIKRPITLSMAFLSHCRMLRGQRRES